MAPQVEEPAYIYEQAPGQVVVTQASSLQAEHLKKDGSSERDQVATEQGTTTVYVEPSGEEGEALRYTTTQVRYAAEAYHQNRYEYHPGPAPEDIKTGIERNHHEPATLHIYESTEGGRPEGQQVSLYN